MRFKSKYAFYRLKQLGAGKSREWHALIQIFLVGNLEKDAKLMKNWLRAFIDDEAYIDISTKKSYDNLS